MTNPMTKLDKVLKEIEDRAEAATEGPWKVMQLSYTPEKYAVTFNYPDTDLLIRNKEAAVFIAHSRTDVPKLCKALRRAVEIISLAEDVLTHPKVKHAINENESAKLRFDDFYNSLADIEKIMGGE